MKFRSSSPAAAVALALLLGACGDSGSEHQQNGAASPAADSAGGAAEQPVLQPDVQLPTTQEIEVEAAVAPEDADDAFEQLKREIEADS